jgi:hypothetical protein
MSQSTDVHEQQMASSDLERSEDDLVIDPTAGAPVLLPEQRSGSSDEPARVFPPPWSVSRPPVAAAPTAATVLPGPPGLAAVPAPVETTPAIGLAVLGTLVVLVGAWAGIVPFVGGLIGLSADGSPAWSWGLTHAVLWLAPGAVAVVLGLGMLAHVPRVRRRAARFGPAWMGFVTAVCGAWLVVGVFAWPTFRTSGAVFVGATPLRQLDYLIGWSLGPGALLVLLGGCAIGLGLRGRATAAVPGAAVGYGS